MYGRVGNRPECVSNGPELSETRRTARRKIKHKITVCRVGATRNTRASILLWVQAKGGGALTESSSLAHSIYLTALLLESD